MSGKPGRIYTRRGAFWSFCVRAAHQPRLAQEGIQFELSAYDIDKLFVDQGWRCAVSKIEFDLPEKRRLPFGPSLDRIAPGGPYAINNVRIVCNIVNFAMNEWGEAALRQLVAKMAGDRPGRGENAGNITA